MSTVEGLGKEAKRLVNTGHFDSANILARQVNCLSTMRWYGVWVVWCGVGGVVLYCGWALGITQLFVLLPQAQLDEQRAGLQTLTAARRSKLEESIKLHQYLRDVEEVLAWLNEKESIASSDDYGKDFDHLLVSVVLSRPPPAK